MGTRKSRKSRKKRGSRTHGGGSARKRRKSGHKGGKGHAGSHKHHWRKAISGDPLYFGKHGFKRPQQLQEEVKTVNVGELDENVEEFLNSGLAERDGEQTVIDGSVVGFDKVLGGGQVTRPLRVIADSFSEKAERKLSESGGAAETGED